MEAVIGIQRWPVAGAHDDLLFFKNKGNFMKDFKHMLTSVFPKDSSSSNVRPGLEVQKGPN